MSTNDFRAMNFKEWIEWNPPPQQSIIENNILSVGSKMVILGMYESWKSWIALYMSHCISTGKPWFGFKTTAYPTYGIQCEGSAYEFKERIIDYSSGNCSAG